MDPRPESQQPDPALQLPRDVYYQLIHTLRATLPPVSDASEDIARRDNAAIAHVASLLPANAEEANLAAIYVAAEAHAMDCLRLARTHYADPALILKCTAQAAGMMRQARATRSLLLRVQAERLKREADTAALDKAAWTEHCAVGLMAQALTDVIRPATAPPPSQPQPDPSQTEADPPASPAGIAAAADHYALTHRNRAALIRSLGRLPDELDCEPLPPALVTAIVTGTSPVLRLLDLHAGSAA